MARITCEDCLVAVGKNNRFNLIHLAVKELNSIVREHLFSLKEKTRKSS